ncbi:permease [Vibrio aestuarianus]|uniref:permease n=1 Tax=Vibrio aestuarianus TaxID=28171 RepID=UPI0021C27880|nr:permease [Vibrio aestuarianus]MDE1210963.1 permease [Vibrio aestuarianus]MDE1253357.1 permease [Vibrio aestuarianus]CAH8239415.1 Permease [Vibrio aestuarianus]
MFEVFSLLADWLTYSVFSITPNSKFADGVHFFIEDTSKIMVLLVVMIYVIALFRASLNVDKVRHYLAGKRRIFGYVTGSFFGAITPFCSCSSIPVFLGFTTAGIPLGITMAFLITSPLINEIAVLLLVSLLGWKFMLMYVFVGMLIGVTSGWFLDSIGAERWLQPLAMKALQRGQNAKAQTSITTMTAQMTLADRHAFAKHEMVVIVSRVWIWVFIGVGIGAGLHGFVPDGWIEAHLGQGQWWSVPTSVLLGIPLYSNATGVIPIMESLLIKGLPIGTTLAFCMSTVAASIPEFVMLKQVMQWRLLGLLFCLLLAAFTVMGWVFNLPIWNYSLPT